MIEDKHKKSTRRSKTINAIERQKRIVKATGVSFHKKNQPHRYAKIHALTCGDSHCAMCGNPRKFFNEKTLQEKKFDQSYKDQLND